jgi:hypothetical protein
MPFSKSNKVVLSTRKQGSSSSKLQKEYASLLKKLEKGEQELLSLQRSLNHKLAESALIVQPHYTTWCLIRIDVARCLFDSFQKEKRNELQNAALINLIRGMLQEVINGPHGFSSVELKHVTSLEHEFEDYLEQRQNALTDEELANVHSAQDVLRSEWLADVEAAVKREGLDVDFNDLEDFLSEEELKLELRRRIERARQIKRGQKAKSSKKKGLEVFSDKSPIEVVQQKGLAEIYKRLVKLIHPDTEQDETRKKEKEEWMKQLTVAYENKDLSTLLMIESKWIVQAVESHQEFSDEKLRGFIGLLKEQLKSQEQSVLDLMRDVRYRPLVFFSGSLQAMLQMTAQEMAFGLRDEIEHQKAVLYEIETPGKSGRRAIDALI